MEWMNDVIATVNDVLWTYILITLLIAAGLWFSVKTGFVQIRLLPEMLRLLTEGAAGRVKAGHISPFQAFCISTASRVGVGNIAGIAIAVVLGGPGAVFWMWMIALIGAASGFVESTLAQLYKVPLSGGGFRGGPAYYIRNVLRAPRAAMFFAVLISVTYGLIFNSVQANTISLSLQTAFGWQPLYIGTGVTLFAILLICGGLTQIARVMEWMVPLMAGIYILTALAVMLAHLSELPSILALILTDAWDVDSLAGGGFGATVMAGIKRGLFSNEAGMGAVPNAAATADASHPVKQGLLQAFGVFVDTLLVCSASAFIVLCSGDWETSGLTGIALIQYDLSLFLGDWAAGALAVFIILFAFSSIVGNYYYSEINIGFLCADTRVLYGFRALVGGMIMVGALAKLELVWNLADFFMALMAITNIIAILLLFRPVRQALADYCRQRQSGIRHPVFSASVLRDRTGIVCWQGEHLQELQALPKEK